MTSGKNFTNQVTPGIIDTGYERCNFSQHGITGSGNTATGIRIFPGDDTPRTFTRCNMCNVIPPPGSTLFNCNTALMEFFKVMSAETVTIDGLDIVIEHHSHLALGKMNSGTFAYEYATSPGEEVVD